MAGSHAMANENQTY